MLYLKGGTKDHFMGFLRHSFPEMAARYERLYPGAYASPEYVGAVRALIDMLQEKFDVNRRARRVSPPPPDSDTRVPLPPSQAGLFEREAERGKRMADSG